MEDWSNGKTCGFEPQDKCSTHLSSARSGKANIGVCGTLEKCNPEMDCGFDSHPSRW